MFLYKGIALLLSFTGVFCASGYGLKSFGLEKQEEASIAENEIVVFVAKNKADSLKKEEPGLSIADFVKEQESTNKEKKKTILNDKKTELEAIIKDLTTKCNAKTASKTKNQTTISTLKTEIVTAETEIKTQKATVQINILLTKLKELLLKKWKAFAWASLKNKEAIKGTFTAATMKSSYLSWLETSRQFIYAKLNVGLEKLKNELNNQEQKEIEALKQQYKKESDAIKKLAEKKYQLLYKTDQTKKLEEENKLLTSEITDLESQKTKLNSEKTIIESLTSKLDSKTTTEAKS